MSITYTSGMNHQNLKATLRSLQGDKQFKCTTDEEGNQTWEWTDGSTPPTVTELTAAKTSALEAEEWKEVRRVRGQLLRASDWTQANDSPLTDSKKTEWATYRTSLRNITTQSDPFNITWPTEPSGG